MGLGQPARWGGPGRVHGEGAARRPVGRAHRRDESFARRVDAPSRSTSDPTCRLDSRRLRSRCPRVARGRRSIRDRPVPDPPSARWSASTGASALPMEEAGSCPVIKNRSTTSKAAHASACFWLPPRSQCRSKGRNEGTSDRPTAASSVLLKPVIRSPWARGGPAVALRAEADRRRTADGRHGPSLLDRTLDQPQGARVVDEVPKGAVATGTEPRVEPRGVRVRRSKDRGEIRFGGWVSVEAPGRVGLKARVRAGPIQRLCSTLGRGQGQRGSRVLGWVDEGHEFLAREARGSIGVAQAVVAGEDDHGSAPGLEEVATAALVGAARKRTPSLIHSTPKRESRSRARGGDSAVARVEAGEGWGTHGAGWSAR